jgi:hypothetical protein
MIISVWDNDDDNYDDDTVGVSIGNGCFGVAVNVSPHGKCGVFGTVAGLLGGGAVIVPVFAIAVAAASFVSLLLSSSSYHDHCHRVV